MKMRTPFTLWRLAGSAGGSARSVFHSIHDDGSVFDAQRGFIEESAIEEQVVKQASEVCLRTVQDSPVPIILPSIKRRLKTLPSLT